MLRITCMSLAGTEKVVKVEGRLVGEWVDELSSVAAGALSDSVRLTLDMSDVTFVDHRGAELLRALRSCGVALVACSRFVSAMLNRESE